MRPRKYKVNFNFFKNWNSQMAYILGFAFADGNVYHNTLSWKLSNTGKGNKKLLRKINKVLGSTYPIEKLKGGFRLRINHYLFVRDLVSLGVIPNKTRRAKFPKIPKPFLRDFIRGFLDGDGWITAKKKKMEISVGFSNGSYEFLNELANHFKKQLLTSSFNLREKIKLTKKKKISNGKVIVQVF